AGGSTIRRARRQVVVRVGKHSKGRSACRVARNHVEQVHFYRVSHIICERIAMACKGISHLQSCYGTLKGAGRLVSASRITSQVEIGSRVGMNAERRRD